GTLNQICRRQVRRYGRLSRPAEDGLGDSPREIITCALVAFKPDDVLRLPKFGTITDAKSFCADSNCGKARLINVAIQCEEAVCRSCVKHFVQRQANVPVRASPVLNRGAR